MAICEIGFTCQFALQQTLERNRRNGSKADRYAATRHVRFAPERRRCENRSVQSSTVRLNALIGASSSPPSWRTQSQSNSSLHPNSLLTGKFTGNFAESGPRARIRMSTNERIQMVAVKFPTQKNRELFRRNTEFYFWTMEISPPNSKSLRIEFSVHTSKTGTAMPSALAGFGLLWSGRHRRCTGLHPSGRRSSMATMMKTDIQLARAVRARAPLRIVCGALLRFSIAKPAATL
jgi:hypothetical protein